MGSGISSESIEKQENYINNKFNKIKNKYPDYNELQLKGRLRNEYHNNYEKDAFVLDRHWNRHLSNTLQS